VSVPEMKAFLGLIINMGLMPLPDIKDYWSSEWTTEIKFFGDIMSRVLFWQIFWMTHVRNNTTERSNLAIKRTKKVHWVIEYIFHFMPLLHKLFEQNSFLGGSAGI
jgi:hypothetical protein